MKKKRISQVNDRKLAYFGEEIEKNVTYVASPIFPNKEVKSRFMNEAHLTLDKKCKKENLEVVI